MPASAEALAHLANVKATAAARLEAKYLRGHREHGGTPRDLSVDELLEEAIDESIDQLVYLLTLKEKLSGS